MSPRVRRSLRLAWAPLVVLMSGACLATRNDVRTLQGDIATLRAQAARADSVHHAQVQQVARQVGSVADSLRSVNAFLLRFSTDVSRFQGDLTLALRSFGQQLIAVQELTGQSQKKLQELRADLETRPTEPAASAAQPPGQPGVPGAGVATLTGPSTLIQLGFTQLTKGSAGAALAAFQDFLVKYPANDLASEAYYGIGQAHEFEANPNLAAADSAYQMVVDRYPKSDKAPLALFKRAMIFRRAGQTAKARALFQQLADRYPSSPEAESAKDYLKVPE